MKSPKGSTPQARLSFIRIEGLFEMFDDKIDFPAGENVLILTGPNVYGKTQILNILNNRFFP
jgi:predicted ATP-binding protein involved in virulence